MNYLEIAGTLIGLLYLWFEYRASIWLWPVSVIMPAIYIVVYYQVGLYADSVISIYYLLAGIYGLNIRRAFGCGRSVLLCLPFI